MEIFEKIELRKQILLELYRSWETGEDWFDTDTIVKNFSHINEIDLDRQIRYLEDKYYLKVEGDFMGKRFMSFDGITITDNGVDLVENKEDFNKLFKIEVNNISDITNSNVIIGNHNISTNQINQIDKIIELLKESHHPDKEEIIKIAAEYKISPSMELFGKLVGMCANTGAVGQILSVLLSSSNI